MTENHMLRIRWRGEPLSEDDVERIVQGVKTLVLVGGWGEWVGHDYAQCDEAWEPRWKE